ncbi:barstar family protein [Oscillospiraceae bacterium MB08-C2-2]|nr:barstar family protein [Oscillospiraceae bacterium MB08-C2-2]
MSEKKIITLDLTDCKNWVELQERIQKVFEFPYWYGKSWDAFWDLLRTDCDADKIEIIGEHTLAEDFEWDFEWHLEQLHEILQMNKEDSEKNGWICDFEILS